MSAIDRRKLAAVLALLSSDKQGERDAAAHAATRMMKATGLSWDEILQSQPAPANDHPQYSTQDWRSDNELLTLAKAKLPALTNWELMFVESIGNQLYRGRHLTQKQRRCLLEICEK